MFSHNFSNSIKFIFFFNFFLSFNKRIFSSETYVIVDAYKYTSDGSGLDGTFTLVDGYITNCQSNTGITSFNLNTDFEFSYKYYSAYSIGTSTPFNSLWNFGVNDNNGVLIGCEEDTQRLRIYNRSNGSNSVQQTKTGAFTHNEWIDVCIKYQSGVWSITCNGYTISYSKTITPSFMRLNGNFTSTRLKELMVKPL